MNAATPTRQRGVDSTEPGEAEMRDGPNAQALEEHRSVLRDINRIIQVIDDIAFQTNLLALNAR
jgi:hypothetical protein